MPAADADLDPPQVETWLARASGGLAFDVGANHGRVATTLARGFDRVVAFEPCRESFEKLAHDTLHHPNITGECVAVSDQQGMVTLVEQAQHIAQGQLTSPDEAGADWAGLVQGSWGTRVGERTVPADTLDSLAAAYGPPDFVKVDVEGHELRVVRGGISLWADVRPRFYIEVHHDQLGQAIWDLLAPLYTDITRLRHPGYGPHEFGEQNHYWLVSDPG